MCAGNKLGVKGIVMVFERKQLHHYVKGKSQTIRPVGKHQFIKKMRAVRRTPQAIQLLRHTFMPGGEIAWKCVGCIQKGGGEFRVLAA